MDQNQFSTTVPEQSFGAGVPPSPSETTIRTMASDVASIAESGGGKPKPKPIKILSLSEQGEKAFQPPADIPVPGQGAPQPPKESFLSSPAFLFSTVAVFLVGAFLTSYYLVYPLLNPKPAETKKTPAVPAETQTQEIERKPVFGKLVDGIFVLDIPSAVNGMQAEKSQISSFIGGVSGSFFEITPRSGDGRELSAAEFLQLIGARFFDASFLDENFEDDFTLFMYKDKSGLWPGYVFQLAAGKTPIFLQNSVVRMIENASSSWNGLFMEPPGNPSDAGFQSGLSSGQPVRILGFSNSSSSIAYGWFLNKYFIISTSIDGLKEAIAHF